MVYPISLIDDIWPTLMDYDQSALTLS